MAIVTTDDKHYKSIADTIREKAGTEATYAPEEMSGGVAEVYDKGKADQKNDFWDMLQDKGSRTDYYYTFFGKRWNDQTYNPKYDIVITTGSNTLRDSTITDTKVTIDMSTMKEAASALFAGCYSLATIRKIISHDNVVYNNTFLTCVGLKNIEFEGTIGKSISFSHSPLSVDSMKSIISHLKDYSLDNTGVYSLTFSDTCWTRLENDSSAPDGGTWREYVEYTLGWNT